MADMGTGDLESARQSATCPCHRRDHAHAGVHCPACAGVRARHVLASVPSFACGLCGCPGPVCVRVRAMVRVRRAGRCPRSRPCRCLLSGCACVQCLWPSPRGVRLPAPGSAVISCAGGDLCAASGAFVQRRRGVAGTAEVVSRGDRRSPAGDARRQEWDRTSYFTRMTPAEVLPMAAKAALERSRQRPPMYGPRSLMRTVTDSPFDRFVTRTLLPIGRVLWAAVIADGLKRSPLAVIWPSA